MYDVAIIGSGPAGLSAALNLKLHNKSIIWFGAKTLSAKVEKSEKIANYPGFPKVSGEELNQAFMKNCEEAGLEITDKMVTNIMPGKKKFMLLADNEIYEAKTLLMAIGSVSPKGFEGEKNFLGRGVSYCATCDGFLYKGKSIAVYCGDERFEHEVMYLSELAEKVFLFASYPNCKIYGHNIQKINEKIMEVKGGLKIQSLLLKNGEELPVDGFFCLRNAVAPATLLPGLQIEGPHIVVDRAMATSVPGCFAAGDCTGLPYQIAKSVGEGNVAAHSMIHYLAEMEK